MKLNIDITSVWLSDDGDGVCDLREFVLNIFTFCPKEVILELKEASFLSHLNDQCRKYCIFSCIHAVNAFEVSELKLTDPVTQEVKGKTIFQ